MAGHSENISRSELWGVTALHLEFPTESNGCGCFWYQMHLLLEVF